VVHDQVASLALWFDAAPRWGLFLRLPEGKKAGRMRGQRARVRRGGRGVSPHGRFRPPIGCIVKKAAGNVPSGRPGWKFIQKELYPSRPRSFVSTLPYPVVGVLNLC
jgi:hypothetical protein